MRKRILGRHFSRDSTSRRALFRALVRALTISGNVKTTRAKAKSLQGLTDKLVVTAKKNTVAGRRELLATLGNDRVTTQALVARFANVGGRLSGFTRITPLPPRKGDNAAMARIEWVDKTVDVKKQDDSEKSKKASTTKNTKVNKED